MIEVPERKIVGSAYRVGPDHAADEKPPNCYLHHLSSIL